MKTGSALLVAVDGVRSAFACHLFKGRRKTGEKGDQRKQVVLRSEVPALREGKGRTKEEADHVWTTTSRPLAKVFPARFPKACGKERERRGELMLGREGKGCLLLRYR